VLAIAGLWATWLDRSTGEMLESYTMLTINADHHPIMSRMHKPDPKLPPDKQDKRSLVLIPHEQIDVWLAGSGAESKALLVCPQDGDVSGAPLLAI
jgi:putative SOS response-associated peptidase YedK